MNPSARRKATQAARVYLDMRQFELLEQNWSQGRNKIDMIAKKSGVLHFITLVYYKNESDYVGSLTLNETAFISRNRAAEAYVTEMRYDGKFIFSQIEMSGSQFSVIAFSSDS